MTTLEFIEELDGYGLVITDMVLVAQRIGGLGICENELMSEECHCEDDLED
mgnify:CR=1 FL=1